MDLILLRHGKAEDSHAMGDSARALVDKGREQARKAARALKRADMLPDIVLSSPLVRAKQTADEFCDTASISGAITQSWLACGMSPETALKELAGFSEFESVMIVGHEPDFSGLVECLLGISSGSVKMKKGGMACIRIHPPARHGTLRWLIPPKLAEDVD
jgi:phosphohistidine phosphatase